MVLMHLVTGQGIKHFMVKETIELAETLYKSNDLQLGPTETKAISTSTVGGNIADTEKYNTKYESYLPSSLSKLLKLTRLPSLPKIPSLNNSISN